MKKLILIGGVLAGGKSTFSHLVGERFGISVVNKDRLKEILGDNIHTSNREENKKLSVIAFEYNDTNVLYLFFSLSRRALVCLIVSSRVAACSPVRLALIIRSALVSMSVER